MTEWTLFEDVRLVDGRAAEASPPTALLVADDHIHGSGAVEALLAEVPTTERRHVAQIQGAGRTLMPGLIDAHCHMTYGNSMSQEEQDIYTSVESRTLRAAWNVRRVLRAGVTSISQPGGSWYIGVALRDAIAQGMVVGPRMSTAGRYITTSNGLTDWYPDATGVPDGSIGSLANTPAEMVANVRHQVKNGVDFIKLADSPMGQYQSFTGDELKLISDVAHQLGRKVTIHARGSAEVGAAVAAGIDWIMHGNVMTDEVVAALASSRIPLVPTLLLLANAADHGHLVGTPKGFSDGARRMLDRTGETLHRAHAAGAVFATGTDSGFAITPYGEFHARELELLMEYAGLSAQECIAAATCNAAPTVGLAGRVGTLESGMLADLILVNGDPLCNLGVLQDRNNIEGVFVGGKPIEFDDREVAWPNDRSMLYSTGTLTATMVARGGAPPGEAAHRAPDDPEATQALWGPGGANGVELVREVADVGRRAVATEPE